MGSPFMRLQKEKAFLRSLHAMKRNLPPFIFFVGNPHLPARIPLCSMIAHTLINIFFHIVYCLSLSLSLSFFHNSHTQMYLPITHSFSIFLFLSFCLSVCHSHTQFLAFFFPFLSICTQYSLVCVLSILYFLAFCAGDHWLTRFRQKCGIEIEHVPLHLHLHLHLYLLHLHLKYLLQ
jgi:hypothetical protein